MVNTLQRGPIFPNFFDYPNNDKTSLVFLKMLAVIVPIFACFMPQQVLQGIE